ncbi:toprim domain-containing protein [Paenibacillus rhizoplanae]
MKVLVLAEKPSVAREIARVLGCGNKQKSYMEGPKYVVTWALGHLVGLAEPEDYNNKYATWALEDLPILPEKAKLKVLRETSQQYKAVQQLMKRQDIEELIVATDAAREGELLARWIMNMAGWKKSRSGGCGSLRRRIRRLRKGLLRCGLDGISTGCMNLHAAVLRRIG